MVTNDFAAELRASLITRTLFISDVTVAVEQYKVLAEGDALQTELNEVNRVTLGLESVLNQIREYSPEGLTPSDARWANLAVSNVLGEYLPISLVPSAESFESASARKPLTAALEATIGEAVSSAWKYVMSLFSRFYAWIKNLVKRIFGKDDNKAAAKELKRIAHEGKIAVETGKALPAPAKKEEDKKEPTAAPEEKKPDELKIAEGPHVLGPFPTTSGAWISTDPEGESDVRDPIEFGKHAFMAASLTLGVTVGIDGLISGLMEFVKKVYPAIRPLTTAVIQSTTTDEHRSQFSDMAKQVDELLNMPDSSVVQLFKANVGEKIHLDVSKPCHVPSVGSKTVKIEVHLSDEPGKSTETVELTDVPGLEGHKESKAVTADKAKLVTFFTQMEASADAFLKLPAALEGLEATGRKLQSGTDLLFGELEKIGKEIANNDEGKAAVSSIVSKVRSRCVANTAGMAKATAALLGLFSSEVMACREAANQVKSAIKA